MSKKKVLNKESQKMQETFVVKSHLPVGMYDWQGQGELRLLMHKKVSSAENLEVNIRNFIVSDGWRHQICSEMTGKLLNEYSSELDFLFLTKRVKHKTP